MTLRTTFIVISGFLALAGFGMGWILTFLHVKPTFFVGGCFAYVVLAMLIGFRFSQGYRHRLTDIEEAATLLGAGRLQHRVADFGNGDEIDLLAKAFNQMGETIAEQVADLQRLAEENRNLAADAERAATMEERQRLARELHDSVSQQLFGLALLAHAAEEGARSAPDRPETLVDQLRMIGELAQSSQREMRALLMHLRPVQLEGRSFVDAASELLHAVAERHGIEVVGTWRVESQVPEWMEEELFRILQEALANALKHAQATAIRVQLVEGLASFELSISDDGRGMGEPTADSYGIQTMRERAKRLGGRLELLPRNPGLTVNVVVPRGKVEN
ncbi:MAG: sensor histidine kinase [Alicyclobacillaceae bacterium]|nr:sensor histidine kinase [Alicyclobacillaceae bacterium]